LIAVGTTDADIISAIQAIEQMQGGIVVVDQGLFDFNAFRFIEVPVSES
jgi:adenine deaminase